MARFACTIYAQIAIDMLHLQSFTFNPFSENTYIIINEEKQCWIVDPGMYDAHEHAQFNQFITSNGLIPQAILNTHAHIDHILGATAVMERYHIPFGLHDDDKVVLQNARGSAMMFGLDLKSAPTVSISIKEGQPLHLGKDTIEVRLAPGHSPGSIIFYYKEGGWAIGGDVLFAGSIGRSDLPGGNHQTLINSIHSQLLTLPDETVIHPGHGPATTIGRERVSNPFLV